MTIQRTILLAVLLAIPLLLALGCAGSHPHRQVWAEHNHGLLYRDAWPARSLTMDHGIQRERTLARTGTPDPWYIGRNDAVASVVYGERYPIYEVTATHSRDHQTISGGRVYDRFQQTTHRRRVIRTRR